MVDFSRLASILVDSTRLGQELIEMSNILYRLW